MIKKIILLLMSIILLNGCAKTMLSKQGFTQEQFEKDLYNCKMTAREQLALEGTNPSSISGAFFLKPKITECMKKRYGYEVIGK